MVKSFQRVYKGKTTLDTSMSELAQLRSLRQNYIACIDTVNALHIQAANLKHLGIGML